MNLNINQFKDNFIKNNEALLDKSLLEEDISNLINYYRDNITDCPDHLKNYLGGQGDTINFALSYLGKIVDKHLAYELTEDGWVRLFAI